MEKKFGGPKLHPKLRLHFLKARSLVFLGIAQDCCLEQCLISSRAETSIKTFSGPNWGRNDLFYSIVVKDPHKLACLNHFCTMKGTETNPTSDKWAIIPSALEKCFYDVILSNMGGGILMILNENPRCLVKW